MMDSNNKPSDLHGLGLLPVKLEVLPSDSMNSRVSRSVSSDTPSEPDALGLLPVKLEAIAKESKTRVSRSVSSDKPRDLYGMGPLPMKVEAIPPESKSTQVARSVTTDSEGLLSDDSISEDRALPVITQQVTTDAFTKILASYPAIAAANNMAAKAIASILTKPPVMSEKDEAAALEGKKRRKKLARNTKAKKKRELVLRKALENLLLDWKDLSFRGFVQTIFSLL